VARAERATAGLASLVGVLLKECSNFVQKTPQIENRNWKPKWGRRARPLGTAPYIVCHCKKL